MTFRSQESPSTIARCLNGRVWRLDCIYSRYWGHCIAGVIALPESSHCRSHRIAGVIALPESSHCRSHRIAGVIASLGSIHCWSHRITGVVVLLADILH
jgi:hypothetical protein